MLCPFKIINNNYQLWVCDCEKENCAWYNRNKEECCVKTLSKNIEEVAEGQRTIFIREC